MGTQDEAAAGSPLTQEHTCRRLLPSAGGEKWRTGEAFFSILLTPPAFIPSPIFSRGRAEHTVEREEWGKKGRGGGPGALSSAKLVACKFPFSLLPLRPRPLHFPSPTPPPLLSPCVPAQNGKGGGGIRGKIDEVGKRTEEGGRESPWQEEWARRFYSALFALGSGRRRRRRRSVISRSN